MILYINFFYFIIEGLLSISLLFKILYNLVFYYNNQFNWKMINYFYIKFILI
jgi:hypothetical protein